MPTQHQLIEAIRDLEADLRLTGRSTCAIVQMDSVKASQEVRRVLQTLSEEGNVINYSLNGCDMRYLEGSGYRLEQIRMTGETMIDTLAGKLVLPADTKYRITSKRV